MNHIFTAISLIGMLSSSLLTPQGAIKIGTSSTQTGQYVRIVDSRDTRVVAGIVTSVVEITRDNGENSLSHLTLKSDADGKSVTVYFSPGWSFRNTPSKIEAKDRVEVKGTTMIKKGQAGLLASEVRLMKRS